MCVTACNGDSFMAAQQDAKNGLFFRESAEPLFTAARIGRERHRRAGHVLDEAPLSCRVRACTRLLGPCVFKKKCSLGLLNKATRNGVYMPLQSAGGAKPG